MKLRRKSLRRLGIIFAVVLVLAGTGLGLAIRSHRAAERRIATDRNAGLAAYNAKDYSKAVEPFERYLKERPNDTKIALAFARARFNVETNTNQHIKQAVEAVDSVLKREPDNLDAKHLLLEIYPQTANTDALERLSDTVLENHPTDTLALLGRIIVRIRQSRLDDALSTTLTYASLQPEDLKSRIRAIELMKALQKPQAEIQAFADQQFIDDKMDPRHLLLQAFACNYRNDNDKAIWFLRQAAKQPLTDSEFVRLLVSLFDQLKRYDESQGLLEQVSSRTRDPEIVRILVARLWQNGRDEEIVERLEGLEPSNPRSDAELVALRAMALYQLQRTTEARDILQTLAKRQDRKAAAWSTALSARFEDYDQPPVAIANKLADALARDPENGIFRTWLADCYWNLGEAALALRQWQSAALALPGWSKPYIGMSQALLILGQAADAHEAAKAAVERVPNDASYINLATIRFRLIDETGDLRSARDLLNLVSQIQQKAPGEPRTLPIYVSLLARTGDRETAIKTLQRVAADSARYDDETLLRLVAVSRNESLQIEDALLASTSARTVSARFALTRATFMAENGKATDGLHWLRAKAESAPPADAIGWKIALAQYLDAVDDPTSADTWRRLGDANARDLTVQRGILSLGKSIRSDRAFTEKTINRLRDLTGEDGQQWRLEKARFLIEGSDIMKDGVEAALLLREIIGNAPRQIEPRLLLARTHELQGNITGAIEHLRTAQSVDPRSATVTLELVRLLQQQGRTDEVRDALKLLSSTAMMNARQRVMLASLMADTGDTRRAIELLEPDESHQVLIAQGRLLLAEFYRRDGQTDRASTIYESLLAGNAPSISAVASAAEFWASTEKLVRAREALDRLDSIVAEPVEKHIARARFEERFGSQESALKFFRLARDTETESGIIALIDYHLRQHDFAEAIAAARVGGEKRPESSLIANRLLEAQALSEQKTDPTNIQPLIDALSRDPSRAAEVAALKTLKQINSGKIPRAEVTAHLRAVADKYPRFLPLQSQVIENYINEKKVEEAVTLARRTMAALPTDPEAARLAVRTMRGARLWGEMKLAAEQWKSRSSSGSFEADIAIAEALLESGAPDAAIKQLSPHRARIDADVRTQPQASVVVARAMLAEGNGRSAQELLKPLLADVSGRRVWQMIALGACSTLEESTTWLAAAQAATPADSLDEKYALAKCWITIARKYDDQKTLELAADRLAEYIAQRPRDGEALLLIGGAYFQSGRLEQAEASLRAILRSEPEHPAAANDLACLLIAQNRSLDEAEKLARLAADKHPANAAYQDTLARALLARGQHDAAKAVFEAALKLDPDLIVARVGYARALKSAGDTAAASRELKRVDTQLKTNPRAGKHLEGELSELRAQLSPGE